MRKLSELSKEEYAKLLATGMMFEFYPEATGDYFADIRWSLPPEAARDFICYRSSHTDTCRNVDCDSCVFDTAETFLEWARGL